MPGADAADSGAAGASVPAPSGDMFQVGSYLAGLVGGRVRHVALSAHESSLTVFLTVTDQRDAEALSHLLRLEVVHDYAADEQRSGGFISWGGTPWPGLDLAVICSDIAARPVRAWPVVPAPPLVRVVPEGTPGRIYGQGYDGSWFDDRTEADKRAAFDRQHHNDRNNDDDADNGDGKGQS